VERRGTLTILSHRVQKGFNTILATSLVHLFPPKHHVRALRIVDDILSQDPDNVICLMNRGYILEASARWIESGAMFTRVSKLIAEDLNDGLRAQEECSWCQVQAHDLTGGLNGLQHVWDILGSLADRDFDQARCLWRLGMCFWEMGGTSVSCIAPFIN